MANLIANSDPHLNPLDYDNLSARDMVQVDSLITAGSEYIERYCNRVFASAVITDEVHNGYGFNSMFVRNPPITTLTQIEIISAYSSTGSDTYDTHEATKFLYDEQTGEINWKPGIWFGDTTGGVFPKGFQNVMATYTGGYSSVPEAVQLLCAEFVIEMYDSTLSSDGIDKEKLGDYFYSRSKDYFENVKVFKKKRILDSYRLRKI